jgi:hypothetical protein
MERQMTIYILQIPMSDASPKVWSAETEQEAIDTISERYENTEFDDAIDAIRHDQRAAYMTDDLFDLYHWSRIDEYAIKRPCEAVIIRNFQHDIEEIATEIQDPLDEDYDAYSAFDGQFIYRDHDMEYVFGNDEPKEADTLAQALLRVSFQRMLANQGLKA